MEQELRLLPPVLSFFTGLEDPEYPEGETNSTTGKRHDFRAFEAVVKMNDGPTVAKSSAVLVPAAGRG